MIRAMRGSPTVAILTMLCIAHTSCVGPTVKDRQVVASGRLDVHLAVKSPTDSLYLRRELLRNKLLENLKAVDTSSDRIVVAVDALGGDGIPRPRRLLTFEVDEWDTSKDDPPTAAIVLFAFGWLLVPLAFVGLVREIRSHAVDFSVALHDLDEATVVLAETPEGPVPRYDTTNIVPFFRGTYHIKMESGRSWLKRELSMNQELIEHEEDIANQLAIRMLNACLADVQQALRLRGVSQEEPLSLRLRLAESAVHSEPGSLSIIK